MKKTLIWCGLLLSGLLMQASAQVVIPLWEKGAPGSESRMHEAEVVDGMNITNIHHPSLTAYLPTDEKSTGVSVLIAPGGGHSKLCIGHEGFELGQWLADQGVAAFVLKYRLSREQNSPYDLHEHALADARRAIRMIRYQAKEWGLKTDKVGFLGFSAGGELVAFSAMNPQLGVEDAEDPVERWSARPDFQALIYPGKSKQMEVHEGMPPVFIVCGYKDRADIADGMATLYLKYRKVNVPAELHIYANAGHGFGYRAQPKHAAGRWNLRFMEWMSDSGLLPKHP